MKGDIIMSNKKQFANVVSYSFGSNQNGWANMKSAVVAGVNGVRDTKPCRVEVEGKSYVGMGANAIAQEVELFANKSVNYNQFTGEIVTSDAVAIRAYSIMKHLKAGLTPAKTADAVMKEADTSEDREQFKKLAVALKDAQQQGVRLRISRLSQEHSYALEVPEGVELQAGDVIKFNKGIADNGVKLAFGVQSSYAYEIAEVNGELKALRPKNTPNAKHRMACINGTLNLIREIKAEEVSAEDLI